MVYDKNKRNEYMRDYFKKHPELRKQRTQKHRELLAKLLEGKCCSVCKSILNLHWHHEDPSTKLIDIYHCPLSKLDDELKKCIILCRHCHRGLHNKDRIIDNPSRTTLNMRKWRELQK